MNGTMNIIVLFVACVWGGVREGGRLGNKEMVGDGGEAVSCENMRKLTLDLTIIIRASRDSVWKYVDVIM